MVFIPLEGMALTGQMAGEKVTVSDVKHAMSSPLLLSWME